MADAVLEDLKRGLNCTAEAVPGAGKTRLLLLASKPEPSLILAYNNELAKGIGEFLTYNATCMTFHALCSKCLGVARDDEQMLDCIERAERGEIDVQPLPTHPKRLLIDEAQDVRDVFVRLVSVCGLGDCQKLVVGDRNQLVYDFDPTFPASLDTLLHAERVFGGTWKHHSLKETHRLTTPMVAVVNHMFGTRISAVHDGRKVQVRSPTNMFRLYAALEDVVQDPTEDILLLVDRKRGNRPLRGFLNDCSRKGHRVSVHGVDDEPARIHCGTFWSAKGVQAKTVVVLLPSCSSRNPTYVAMTRSFERLIVVLDPKEPHAAFCQAAVSRPESVDVRSSFASDVIRRGADLSTEDSLVKPEHRRGNALGRIADFFVPSRACVKEKAAMCIVRDESTGVDTEGETFGMDVATVAVKVALIACERWSHSRRTVRHVEDILSPTRLDSEQVVESIRRGLVSRWVSRTVTDHALLADDLAKHVRTAYAQTKTEDAFLPHGIITLALACLAWDDFDHIMRKQLSNDGHVQVKMNAFTSRIEWLREVLTPPLYRWDVRLLHDDVHCRVHASNAERCLHIVWERTTNDEAAAALRASLHPNRECWLVELGEKRIREVKVEASLYED